MSWYVVERFIGFPRTVRPSAQGLRSVFDGAAKVALATGEARNRRGLV